MRTVTANLNGEEKTIEIEETTDVFGVAPYWDAVTGELSEHYCVVHLGSNQPLFAMRQPKAVAEAVAKFLAPNLNMQQITLPPTVEQQRTLRGLLQDWARGQGLPQDYLFTTDSTLYEEQFGSTLRIKISKGADDKSVHIEISSGQPNVNMRIEARNGHSLLIMENVPAQWLDALSYAASHVRVKMKP